ncbi:MAG: dipeptide epimerase [Thermoflavifilum sp.]|nr:dipeptide epimerase [Thermoflavifilum sp.]
MAKLDLYPLILPFEYEFTISRHSKREQPVLIVAYTRDDITGYGETAENAYYQVKLHELVTLLKSMQETIEQLQITDPDIWWKQLKDTLQGKSVKNTHLMHFALCAVDMALWDWYARKQQKPLYRFWCEDPVPRPFTDYTIGIDEPDRMLQKMQAHPWPIYKIKVGTPDDLPILRMLRKHTHAGIRIDANAGWTFSQLQTYYPICQQLQIACIEQPLPAKEDGLLEAFSADPSLPLFADESCVTEHDVVSCAKYFQGINIKLTKCGGITPALRMIRQARKLGLQVMIGSMNESMVGTSAAAHLLPLADEADLDGPLLLKANIAQGISYHHGEIHYSSTPGSGVTLLPTLRNYLWHDSLS